MWDNKQLSVQTHKMVKMVAWSLFLSPNGILKITLIALGT